ncbi:MAG: hypothetical protein OES26_00215 [Gammaproteobacteria bacterium]|nr:hypothetical protein [Gammaproteobacteria bacterium]
MCIARFQALPLNVVRMTTLLIVLAALNGCAGLPTATPPGTVYIPTEDGMFGRFAPLFVHENDAHAYNRIGRPAARYDERGEVSVYVDPLRPAIFTERREFESSNGTSYTNFIYRVHFESVPVRFRPFHISAGRNVGLLVVVTVNEKQEPVLYTTVHTCGCYTAFVPTGFLPASARPANWEERNQELWGEQLPAVITIARPDDGEQRPLITLRAGSHRVKDIGVTTLPLARSEFRAVAAPLTPVTDLKYLALDNGTTVSFFDTEGARAGYVRGTFKPFELLLVSWWALDVRAGVDKDYGRPGDDGPRFYTSFRPWKRNSSDMRDFAGFLDYWGWRL